MQKIILSICISLIIVSILYILIPTNNMASAIKFTLNLFVVSIIIVPIIKNIVDIDFSGYSDVFDKNKNYVGDMEEKVNNSNKKNLEYALKIVFNKKGYNDLEISIDIDKNNKTSLINLKVPSNKNYDAKKIEEIVKTETGITPKIEYY